LVEGRSTSSLIQAILKAYPASSISWKDL
jgi:hypothetical protein